MPTNLGDVYGTLHTEEPLLKQLDAIAKLLLLSSRARAGRRSAAAEMAARTGTNTGTHDHDE
jgi:hypothetical protein